MRNKYPTESQVLCKRLCTRFVDSVALTECPSCRKKLPPSEVSYPLVTTWGTIVKVCYDCHEAERQPFKYSQKENM
jgi:hypothetical protein